MANMSPEAKEEILNRFIPHALDAIDALKVALDLSASWEDPQPMQIFINDKIIVDGNLNAFLNPVIEAGIIHCRAILDFLGLMISKDGQLRNRPNRRPDDAAIECFTNATGPLAQVSPTQALSHYTGEEAEAEQALLSVLRIANKGLAHLTSSFIASPEESRLLEIASRGIRPLIVSHLYIPLNRPAPASQISSRPR